MAVHLIRRVRTRQPSAPTKIDFSNRLANGLRVAVAASIGEVNLVTRVPLTDSVVGPDLGACTFGRSLHFTGAQALASEYVTVSGEFTIVAIAVPGTTGTQAVVGNTAPPNWALWLPISGKIQLSGGNDNYIDSGVAVTSGTPYIIGVSVVGTDVTFCINGTLYRGTTPSAPSFTQQIVFGARSSSGDWTFTGEVAGGLFFDKGKSDAELIALVNNPWQVFAPETIPLFFSTVTAQYARPTSDVSAGTWTASSGSDLFAMLDETSANDADYIVTTGTSTCEVALGTLSDPASSSGHIVRYRIAADSGGITVRLRQGTTTIATWTHASAPTSLTTYEQTLTGGEADSITDYSALRLQFEAT